MAKNRRVDIIATTANLMIKRSLNAITISDVARECGLKKPLIGYYFQSKYILLKETLDWIMSTQHPTVYQKIVNREMQCDKSPIHRITHAEVYAQQP